MKKGLLLFLVLDMLCLSLSACNGSRDIPRETDADKPPEVQEPETYETAPELKELIFGEIPNLGLGTLVYTVPDKDDEDYRLYFFASESEEDRYRSLTEMNFDLSTADYVFPDVREGNVSIGKLNGIYFIDTIDMSGDPVDDVFVIATYETDGNEYYDTRVYEASENGYVVNAVLTQELNEKYYNVEEYPVEDVISLPDDSQMGFSRTFSTTLTYEEEQEEKAAQSG